MAGLARQDRAFHLSLATQGLAPSVYANTPVGLRGFYWIASRHGVSGRPSAAHRNADLIHQQMTVRAIINNKIFDKTKIVILGDDDLIKVSSSFSKTINFPPVTVSANFMRVTGLDK